MVEAAQSLNPPEALRVIRPRSNVTNSLHEIVPRYINSIGKNPALKDSAAAAESFRDQLLHLINQINAESRLESLELPGSTTRYSKIACLALEQIEASITDTPTVSRLAESLPGL